MNSSVEKITDQILAEATIEFEIINTETQEKTKEIQLATEKEIEKIKSSIVESGKGMLENESKRTLGQSRLEAKMNFLNAKEEGLQVIFTEGKLKLTSLTNSSEYSKIIADLAITAGLALGGGDLTLSLREIDKSKVNLDSLSREISEKSGIPSKLTIESSITTKLGGLIINKGDIWVDNTFEAIIDRR
ncbi:MAG: V-type ATP synthase subunit E, partial [Candidatus Hodarchaeales archaeon]